MASLQIKNPLPNKDLNSKNPHQQQKDTTPPTSSKESKKSEMPKTVVQPKITAEPPSKAPFIPSLVCGYPKGSFFCLGSEFAERFSFYGMRSILTMYMKNIHKMQDHEAKLVYHAFVSLAYFTPLVGSLMADGFLGRYKVILYITILYCVGHVILTSAAVPQFSIGVAMSLDFIGLFVIAFGTGGIKPCVSSFAADQFPPTMVMERKKFGSFFYFTITLGSLLSEALTPQLSYINCLGQQFCYPLAFGVPAIFVFLGLIVFVLGKRFYRIVIMEKNTLVQVVKCTCYAIKRCNCKCNQGHWLDSAKEKYDERLVEDVKSLCHVFLLFVPAISFWALFDQQGSTWVLQANRMDGHFGYITVRPDQLTVLNPFFVIVLVPIVTLLIYPNAWKRNMLVRPLRRMGYGCVFAVLSFVVAGIVQLFINRTMIVKPAVGKFRLVIVNMGECELVKGNDTWVPSLGYKVEDVPKSYRIDDVLDKRCLKLERENFYVELDFTETKNGYVVVIWHDANSTHFTFDLKKPIKGQSIFYAIFHPDLLNENVSILLSQDNVNQDPRKILTPNNSQIFVSPDFIGTTYYDIVLQEPCVNDTSCFEKKTTLKDEVYIQNGGVYCLLVDKNENSQLITLVEPNSVSMAWMIPQYFLITIGEILFAISGGEFSYGQAAPTMKSTVQSCWLMSVAFGNVIDMMVSGTRLFENAAVEYFAYAVLMLAFTLVFIYLASKYIYIERDKMEIEKQKKTASKKSIIKKITSKKSSVSGSSSKQNGTSEKQLFTSVVDT